MRSHLKRLALVVLVGAFFAPAKAAASCGDYVMVGSGHENRHSPAPSTAPDSKPRATNESVPAPQSPRPCPGPGCSTPPAQPLTGSTASPVSQRPMELAIAFARDLCPANPLSAFCEETQPSLPMDRASAVYHPPR